MQIGDFSMRPLQESDLRQVLEWRNSEHVRSVMLTQREITWDEHYDWFKRHEGESPCLHFIFEYNGQSIGYIGYNDVDFLEKVVKHSGVYLGEYKDMPFVCGLALFFFMCAYAFDCLDLDFIEGTVLEKNKISLFISKKLGYEILGKAAYETGTEPYYIVKLRREVYEIHRNKIIESLMKQSEDKTMHLCL